MMGNMITTATRPPRRKYSHPCTPQVLQVIARARGKDGLFHMPRHSYDLVYPNIIIGKEETALDKGLLQKLGITHVVNCAQGPKFGHVNTSEEYYQGTGMQFYAIKANDVAGFNIAPFLEPTANYIDQALKSGGKLLVHCCEGFSRSTTVVVAYLMLHKDMDVRDALKEIRSKREVCPNQGFMQILCDLNTQLDERRRNPSGAVETRQKYTTPCTEEDLELIITGKAGMVMMPSHASDEVYPNIIIADNTTALDKGKLEKLQVTHVVNCAQGPQYGHVNTTEEYYQETGMQFYAIKADDSAGFNIMPLLEPTANYIDQALKSEGKVVVHCCEGFSRSATVVVAYLMLHKDMDARDALKEIRSKREVCPNEGFMKILCDLNVKLEERR
ncbi:dual specificity phosphatase 29-like isoform X2 [Amphiura filiformis]|uniref:dual specificity phosphatase 29-like isoform X2 n=1 Tax=Amphiura filiformis TaxID=82378 RepID=UPI003B2131B5